MRDKTAILKRVRFDGLELQYLGTAERSDKDIVLAAVASNCEAFRYADETLRGDKEVTLAAVSRNGRLLAKTSKELKADKEVVLAAVRQEPTSLKFANDALKADRVVAMAALATTKFTIRYITNRDVILEEVRRDGQLLQQIPQNLRADKEIVTAAIAQDPEAERYADDTMKASSDIVKELPSGTLVGTWKTSFGEYMVEQIGAKPVFSEGDAFGHLTEDVSGPECRRDPVHGETTLEQLRQTKIEEAFARNEFAPRDEHFMQYWHTLPVIPQKVEWYSTDVMLEGERIGRLRMRALENGIETQFKPSDKEEYRDSIVGHQYSKEIARALALAKVSRDGRKLRGLPEEFRRDEDIVMRAVAQDASLFNLAANSLRTDDDFREKAIETFGASVTLRDDALGDDYERLAEAVSRDGTYLRMVPDEFKDDKDVVLLAVKNRGDALQYASSAIRADKEVVLAAVANRGYAFRFADDSLRADRGFVVEALELDGTAFQFASDELRADKDMVIFAITSNPEALKFAEGNLSKDPQCLAVANAWTAAAARRPQPKRTEKGIYCVKFSLAGNSTKYAADAVASLAQHPEMRKFQMSSPFATSSSDLRDSGPCGKTLVDEQGRPNNESRWRFQFCEYQTKCKQSNGFMLQLAECRKEGYSIKHELGAGQRIEEQAANQEELKVFRVRQGATAIRGGKEREPRGFDEQDAEDVASAVLKWYASGAASRQLQVVELRTAYARENLGVVKSGEDRY